MKVRALQSFEHAGPRRRGTEFDVSQATGEALAAKGLVEIVEQGEPDPAGATEPELRHRGRARRVAAPQE